VKKFLISVVVGSCAGALLALGFLYIAPRLPDIFADVFFYPSTHSPVMVVQDIKKIFAPVPEQYFIPSIDERISTTTKVVYADLGAMQITMFDKGEQVAQYPIRSVGREGTAWQTPLGMFDMSYKTQNHFSSIGHVWMPYSMHFFGNYFIHGWPYYEGGMPVAEGYSGGCIRLNTPDAQMIYEFVDKETDLVITTSKKEHTQKEFQYEIKTEAPLLESKFLVADIETGEVVAAHGAQEQLQAISFAKIMTGLISLETLNQYQEAVLNQDIVKISDVIYALLLGDNSDAGEVLYQHKNKPQYLLDMNTRAQSLGMTQTMYKDVNGSASSTVSTLEDTFRLLQYVREYKPFLLKVLSLDSYTLTQSSFVPLHPLTSSDEFVAGFANQDTSHMITLKTLVPQSSDTGTSTPRTFVFVVYASQENLATQDTQSLIDWASQSVSLRAKE
jgi:L,D-transpeptidase catalytic domain